MCPPEASAPEASAFCNLIEELRAFSEVNSPDMLFDEIVEKTGYVRALQEKNTQEDTARAENVQELKSSIITYMTESGDSTLTGYLANVALYTDLDNYDTSASAVTLMTMHSSKGLEFPHVFLVGMEETIFPSMQAIGESEEMQEERRLCYVAITRAMKTLNLVCARERMIFGKTTANRVSRFVDEIPEEDIHKNVPKGYGYRDQEQSSYRQKSESGYGTNSSYRSAHREARSPQGRAEASAVSCCGRRRASQGLWGRNGCKGHPHGERRPAGDLLPLGRYQKADAANGLGIYGEGVNKNLLPATLLPNDPARDKILIRR